MKKIGVSDREINKIPNLKSLAFAATVGGLLATSPIASAKGGKPLMQSKGYSMNNELLPTIGRKGHSNNLINGKNCYKDYKYHRITQYDPKPDRKPGYNFKTQYGLYTQGAVMNGDVEIIDSKGNNIYNTFTDSKGQVIIDKNVLLENLNDSGYEVEDLNTFELPLTIKVNGGTILDSNDDFCADKKQKSFNGEYSAIGDIAQLNNGTIGTISTLVENIVNGHNNENINTFLSEYGNNMSNGEEINEVTERLKKSINLVVGGLEDRFKLRDSNYDGTINYNDILVEPYKQRDTNNILNKYKKIVRKGNENKKEKKENWVKTKMNLVILEHTYTGEKYIVKMDSITDGTNVKYSYQKNGKNGINIDINDEIILQEGDKIYFREKYNSKRKKGEINTVEVRDGKLYRNTEIIGYPVVENNEEEIDYEELNYLVGINIDEGIIDNGLEELILEIKNLEEEIYRLENSETEKENIQKRLAEIEARLLILREELRLEAIKTQELLAENDTIALNSTDNLTTLLAGAEKIVTEIGNSIISTANAAEITYTQALQDAKAKISELNTQISNLVKTGSLANLEYMEDREGELRVSIHNLEDDVARLKNTMDGDQASVNMALRNIDGTQANKQEYTDLLTNIIFPDKSNFPINQGEFPEYHLEVLEEYTYKGMNMKGIIDMTNGVSFPAELYTTLDGKRIGGTITINSAHHKYNVKDPLAEFLEYYLRKKYYTDKLVELNQELIGYRNDLEISTNNYNTENNLFISEKQAYLDLKTDFTNTYQITEPIPGSSFPNDFDGIVSSLYNEVYRKDMLLTLIKKNRDSLETKIAEQNTLVDEQAILAIEESNLDNQIIYLSNLNEEVKQLVIESQTYINNNLEQLKIDYTSNYSLETSTNFSIYPGASLEKKNGYEGIIKNRNGLIFHGQQTEINKQDYIDYPFILYIKFNNFGTGNDYPALVWIEYKVNASDGFSYSTEQISINSREDLNNGILISLLKNKVKANIDLRRNDLGEEVDKKLLEDYPNSDDTRYRLNDLSPLNTTLSADLVLLITRFENATNSYLISRSYSSIDDYERLTGISIKSKTFLNKVYSAGFLTENDYQQYSNLVPERNELFTMLLTDDGLKSLKQNYFPEYGGIDGMNQALEDYIIGIADSLNPTTYVELLSFIKKGLLTLVNGEINIDLSNVPDYLVEGLDIFKNIDIIIEGLTDYDKGYYKSYAATYVALNQNPYIKINKVKKFAGNESRELNFLQNSNKYAKGLKLTSINGFEYRIKQGAIQIQRHIKDNPNYTDPAKSYFNTSNLDEVIELHEEAMDKIPKNVFDTKPLGVLVNMDRDIGIYAKHNSQSKFMRIIIAKDGNVHGFPDVINGSETIY